MTNNKVLVFIAVFALLISIRVFAGGNREGTIYWSTSNESGDFADWWIDQEGEAVFNNDGPGNEVTISAEAARTGRYSVKMEVWDIDKYERACRIFRWAEHLTEGYFSSWLMFPVIPEVDGWNNIFQVKKKDYDRNIIDPTFIHQISWDEELGGGRLTLDHWNEEIDIVPAGPTPVIRPNEWFHIEWYYRDGVDDGALKVWVNDELTWSLENVNTRGVDPDIQWGLSLYGDGVSPGHHVMYADDHVIADHRVGSQFFGDSVPRIPLIELDPYETKLDGILTAPVPVGELNTSRYVGREIATVGSDAANLIDGDPGAGSSWEVETGWQSATYSLSEPAVVSAIDIAWAFIDEQVTTFSVEASVDGVDWASVLSLAQSRLNETGFQRFAFGPVKAQFVRITGHYNDTGEWAQWISVTEVAVLDASGTALPVASVETTAAQYPNVGENTLDGNTGDSSRWSAETDWQELELSLERSVPLSAVALALPFGDESRLQFDVYVSDNRVVWDKVIADRVSAEGATGLMVYGFEVGTRIGRHVRFVPKYTTDPVDPGRIVISEIMLFGPPE